MHRYGVYTIIGTIGFAQSLANANIKSRIQLILVAIEYQTRGPLGSDRSSEPRDFKCDINFLDICFLEIKSYENFERQITSEF